MISSQKLKKLLTVHTGKKYDQSYLDNYANTIYKDIDNRVLNNVLSKTDKDTHNILISASPHLYVKRIIELLEWKGSGSYFEEGKFINLYSQEKVNWLSNNYPSSKFKYYFAISNCHSDDYLLNLFEKSIFWENQ